VLVKSNTITKLLDTGRVKSVFIPEVAKKTPSFCCLIPVKGKVNTGHPKAAEGDELWLGALIV
jgi:hypothetical protein